MDDQLPYGMSFCNWTSGCGLPAYALKDLHERRAMPGLALKGKFQLINDEGYF
jgi:hypothetical protein